MKHSIDIIDLKKSAECGHHYCTGHHYWKVVCSCGHVFDEETEYRPKSEDIFEMLTEHRLDVIEEKMKEVSFKGPPIDHNAY